MTTKYVGAGLDLGGVLITNSGSPSGPTDLANKSYVDNLVNGLSFKDEVAAATTGNGTLATAFAAGQTIDGVTLTTGMRLLLKNQTAPAENGIYIVPASGAPARAADANSTAALAQATVRVVAGTAGVGTQWTQGAVVTTVGTTGQTWSASGGGVAYTAGASGGLTLVSTAFSILLDSSPGLLLGAGGIKVDPSYSGLAKRASGTVASGSTTVTIAHGMGVTPIAVTFLDASGNVVEPDLALNSTNIVAVFGVAPTTSQYTWAAMA